MESRAGEGKRKLTFFAKLAKSRSFTVNKLVMRSKSTRGGDAPIKV
jgi:hypothetical protein